MTDSQHDGHHKLNGHPGNDIPILIEKIFKRPHNGIVGANADRPVSFAFALNKRAACVRSVDVNWGGLYENVFSPHAELPDKDLGAAIYAELVDGRDDESVIAVTAIAFDIDGALSSHEVERRIKESDLEAIYYTTYNHRNAAAGFEGVDRLRANFLLDRSIPIRTSDGCIGVDAYPSLYAAIGNDIFGVGSFDLACSNPAHLNYLPSHPPGATEFFVRHLPGKLLVWADYWREAEAEIATKRAARRQAWEETAPASIGKIKSLLESISPDSDYPIWRNAIWAVAYETKGSDAGLKLVHDWSARAAVKDYREKQVDDLWEYALNVTCDSPCAIGTLIKYAREQDADFNLDAFAALLHHSS